MNFEYLIMCVRIEVMELKRQLKLAAKHAAELSPEGKREHMHAQLKLPGTELERALDEFFAPPDAAALGTESSSSGDAAPKQVSVSSAPARLNEDRRISGAEMRRLADEAVAEAHAGDDTGSSDPAAAGAVPPPGGDGGSAALSALAVALGGVLAALDERLTAALPGSDSRLVALCARVNRSMAWSSLVLLAIIAVGVIEVAPT